MNQVTLDFTSAGSIKAIKHFLAGVLLYAAVGGLTFAVQYVGNLHPGTMYDGIIVVGVSEALQAVSKWLTAQQTQFTAPTVETAPDGSVIGA